MKNQLLNRIIRDRLGKPGAALLTLTFSLAAIAHSAFGQSIAPPVTDLPASGEPVHSIVPIHIDQTSGDIKVGLTTYHGAVNALHLLAIQRKPNIDDNGNPLPPTVIADGVFTAANSPDDANQFLQNILAATPDALLIANAVNNQYSINPGSIAKSLEQFGGQVDLEGLPYAVNLVFAGNGGRKMGGALQRLFYTTNVDGYLAPDSNGNYTFIQTDYVRYDITTDGTITIGGTPYTAAASFRNGGCDVSNSFRLVVADRETLQVTVNNSYCTAQGDNQIQYLIGDLGGVTAEGELVFLGTAGHPIPANWNFGTDGDGRFYPLAQEVAKLGGYFETIIYLTPSDTYSLVGAPPPPSFVAQPRSRARESSTVYPGHPTGELHGILARGRDNWYSPINADATGNANLDFYDQVLAQAAANPEATFPPLDSTQLGYFQTISNALCPGCNGNVRNNYHNTNNQISNYITTMESIKDPGGVECSQSATSDFCKVWQQIDTELKDVNSIQGFATNLSTLGTATGINNLFDLFNTWQTVQNTLPTPTQPTAPSLVSPIVNLVLGTAAAAPTPLAPLFGLADTFFNFGESLATDPSGNKTASLAGPVANLAQQAQDNFTAQLNSVGVQFDLIYQNWQMTQALGTFLASGEGKWGWGVSTANQIASQMDPAIKQSMYQSLMSAVYAIGRYLPNDPGWNPSWGQTPLWAQPSAYFVYSPHGPIPPVDEQDVQPFTTSPLWYSSFTYTPYTYPNDPTNSSSNSPYTSTILADYSWLAISLQTSQTDAGSAGHYDPPAGPILSTLFTPVGQNSPEGQHGLGVYRPAFFEGWPFPQVTCTPSGGHGSPGGCTWNSGAPPLEALPLPPTRIAIKIDRVSGSGNRVELRLAIQNTGTKEVSSIDISQIGLRTLAGTGDATLLDPLPIHIENLAPGKPAIVVLHVEVPQTVNQLELRETGVLDGGTNSPDNFSLNQVLLLTK